MLEGTSGTLRRTKLTRYRCSLPGLAGFAGNRRTKPEVPPIGEGESRREKFAKRDLGRKGESNTGVQAVKVLRAWCSARAKYTNRIADRTAQSNDRVAAENSSCPQST